MTRKGREFHSVNLTESDQIKIMGPYGLELGKTATPYLFIHYGQYRCKLDNNNTKINLNVLVPNEWNGRVKEVKHLDIHDPLELKWEKTPRVRLRSRAKKQEQLDEILELGRQMFTNQGRKSFSLRQLARQCNMTVGNLYGYVDGKRELWYAIRNRDFMAMEPIFDKIVKSHRGSVKDLLLNLANEFIKFAREDIARFKMLFAKNAPPSKINPRTGVVSVGPYEEETRGAKILDGLVEVIQSGIEFGEIKETDPGKILYLVMGYLQGNILAGHDYSNLFKKEDPSEFDEFILGKLKVILDDL